MIVQKSGVRQRCQQNINNIENLFNYVDVIIMAYYRWKVFLPLYLILLYIRHRRALFSYLLMLVCIDSCSSTRRRNFVFSSFLPAHSIINPVTRLPQAFSAIQLMNDFSTIWFSSPAKTHSMKCLISFTLSHVFLSHSSQFHWKHNKRKTKGNVASFGRKKA